MSCWNYRIVRYRDGSGFGLHEVYYDDAGRPFGMTENPIGFCCDSEEGSAGIRGSLKLAIEGACGKAVMDEPSVWPGGKP